MVNGGIDWNITPELKLSVDARYNDGYYSTDENKPAYEVDPYAIANARMSYALNGKTEIYSYVNNIFDERTPTYLSDDRSVGGIVGWMMEPRMFGVGIRGQL